MLTDRLSDLLLTPSRDAERNLLAEGIPSERIVFVGNVMIDTLLSQLPKARDMGMALTLGLGNAEYVVVTLHRPSNVDSRQTLEPILKGLAEINKEIRVVLPIHPRTRKNAEKFGLAELLDELLTIPSLSYLKMLSLTDGAAVVLTDSGGLQEETTVLGIPCITLREQTERPVTLTEGTNRLVPWPLTPDGIVESFHRAKQQGRLALASRTPEGWDGSASARIADALSV